MATSIPSRRIAVLLSLGVSALAIGSSLASCGSGETPPATESPEAGLGARPPNVLFVMYDDLGLGDLGAYGGTAAATPNIDSLAREGTRLDAYHSVSPVCSPARFAVLTGLHPARYGMLQVIRGRSRRALGTDVETIASRLRSRGYRTAHVGKWGLGAGPPHPSLAERGFDHSVLQGPVADNKERYTRFRLIRNQESEQPFDQTRHLTSALTDEALRLLEEFAREDPDRPFFMNLWYFTPHLPLVPPPGSVPPSAPRSERYAAMIEHADGQLGRILLFLQERGLLTDTLIVITSDNGGLTKLADNGGLRGGKGQLWQGGLRTPAIAFLPGRIPPGTLNSTIATGLDWMPTLSDFAGIPVDRHDGDGRSLRATLESGVTEERAEPLFFEYKGDRNHFEAPGNRRVSWAVRKGDWKLVFPPEAATGGSLQLTRLPDDPAERIDRSGAHQEIALRLEDEYRSWRLAIGRFAPAIRRAKGAALVGEGPFALEAGERLEIGPDPRLNAHDGDFTFALRFRAEAKALSGRHRLAAHGAGWSIDLIDGRPELRLRAEGGETATLRGAPIDTASWNSVAFTIFDWKWGASSVTLYQNGRVVGDEPHAIEALAPTDESIVLGGGFVGDVAPPFLSTLCLDDEQVALASEF